MLHIILLILKIIGILVLIILGMAATVIILALLVPVRYRVNGSWYEKVKGKVKVTWLLHILSITAAFDEKMTISVRLFGFKLFKPEKETEEDFTKETLSEAEDFMVETMEIKEPHKKEAAEEDSAKGDSVKGDSAEGNFVKREKAGKKAVKKEKKPITEESFPLFLLKIKQAYQRVFKAFAVLKEKKEEVLNILSNKENQKTAKLVLKQGKKLVCHILPGKGRGKIIFGFEDPYLTGQVLMAAAAAYPFCHKLVEITPVFDQTVFEGEGDFKGRIRLGTLIFIGVRLLLDKNFRVLLKSWLR